VTASFRPRLVNGRFGDPALFIEIVHQREAILLDIGDLAGMSPRDLLRVRHIGLSHMHIDHLIGFDSLLRVNVGRDATIHVVGPEGVTKCLGHKLNGYAWDLVGRYQNELTFEVREYRASGELLHTRFRMSEKFRAQPGPATENDAGVVLETPRWTMSATILEHHGPCLAFAVREPRRINVWRNRVEELGLTPGPWLEDLKEAIRCGLPRSHPIRLPSGEPRPLQALTHLISETPGEKLGYVTDIRDTPANRAKVAHLCEGADVLFIEASFAAKDRELAHDRGHLTTTAAGEIGRAAHARRVIPFHFSPRYLEEEERHLTEVERAFTEGAHS
jgi:ribonuclease Z